MKYVFLFFLFIGLFLSCEKPELGVAKNNNEIDLYNLQVGQISKFEFFVLLRDDNANYDLFLTGDTLVVEVLEEVTIGPGVIGYVIDEYVTPGSHVFDSTATHRDFIPFTEAQNIWTFHSGIGEEGAISYEPRYHGIGSPDSIGLVNYSLLFGSVGFYEKPFVPLANQREKEIDLSEENLSDVRRNLNSEEDIYVSNLELSGVTYDTLNVFVYRTNGTADDSDAAWLYNEEHGLVRAFQFCSFWCDWYWGWQKIG